MIEFLKWMASDPIHIVSGLALTICLAFVFEFIARELNK